MGWQPVWFAEIEPFPSAVLAHHWPDVPNLGDMTAIADNVPAPDVLVGGTPCQAFSVAGLRGGLQDERGALSISFVRLADAIDNVRTTRGDPAAVIVWENVPGVLSSKDNAFGCFLGALAGEDCPLDAPGGKWANAGCVFGPQRAVAWRVLDAQYFGVAQRRRRVFVVASARDGFDPARILFEFDGLRRDSAPSRKAGKAVAALTANGVGTCGADENQGQAGHLIATSTGELAHCLNAGGMGRQDYETETMVVHGTQDHCVSDIAFAQGRNSGGENVLVQAVAFTTEQTPKFNNDCALTLTKQSPTGGGQIQSVMSGMAVRRLTPVECERLQGFPDGHTLVPHRGKPAANGPRYKALGNSMAVPCMAWIGKRINAQLLAANDNGAA